MISSSMSIRKEVSDMRAYCNRARKIADGQYDDALDCGGVTKVKCKSARKRRILRPFKKSARRKVQRLDVSDLY